VTAANNPVPAITALSPSSATAGSAAFALTVSGTGFINGSVVNFNGSPRTTTFVSATQLTAALLASDIASVGTPAVTVTNPTPGGGTSNSVTFNVTAANNPVPAITALSPTSVTAGASAFTLTVNGSGFVNGAVVNFNGSARTTSYVSATQLTAAILASDVATVWQPSVTVTNPTPGGGTSNSLTFVVSTPLTASVTLTPSSLTFSAVTGTTSTVQPVTLQNTGTASLSLSSIAITGTNPSDFSETNNCGSSVAAGASCTISVSFTPSSAASFTATLSVTDTGSAAAPSAVGGARWALPEATATSTQTVALSGTGTAATAPAVSLTPASLSFTAVTGTTSATQPVTLQNTGNTALTLSGITLTGTNPSDFSQTNNCGSSLTASASCTISVTFTPASAASFSATLSVADNVSGSPQTVTLSGTGTAAPSFTVSSSGIPQIVQPGGSASYTLTVTPVNGSFANAVTFAASGLPTGATASFSPASVTPGSSPATSTLTIQTAPATASAAGSSWPLAAPVLAFVGLLFLPGKRRRRWITAAVLVCVSLTAFTALTGCGGGFALNQQSKSQSQSQTYTVTVTATSGSVQQSTTVQLTVQ